MMTSVQRVAARRLPREGVGWGSPEVLVRTQDHVSELAHYSRFRKAVQLDLDTAARLTEHRRDGSNSKDRTCRQLILKQMDGGSWDRQSVAPYRSESRRGERVVQMRCQIRA